MRGDGALGARAIILDLLNGSDYVLGEVAADLQAHFPDMSWTDAVNSSRAEITLLLNEGKAKIYRELSFKPRKIEAVGAAEAERVMSNPDLWVSSNEFWVGKT